MTVSTLTVCAICGKPVSAIAPTTGQRVTGWELRGISTSRRSGSDIVARKRVEEFAHRSCIERERLGLPRNQMSLDGGDVA